MRRLRLQKRQRSATIACRISPIREIDRSPAATRTLPDRHHAAQSRRRGSPAAAKTPVAAIMTAATTHRISSKRRPKHTMPDQPTIFRRIIDKEIPAQIVYEDDRALAFHDIRPQAPVHVLIIPKKEIVSLAHVEPDDAPLIGHLFVILKQVADDLGLDNGYRVVINCGDDGGQEVPHLHLHLLGKRRLTWPPG
jgi:histidine triad (HIT) family protein